MATVYLRELGLTTFIPATIVRIREVHEEGDESLAGLPSTKR